MDEVVEPAGAAIENLYPALTQCFAIIICGYFAGRMNYISDTEAKGINTFVGTFSLPSLIFMSLAELDLSAVNWMFLLSILIAKSIVFFAVIIVVLLVGRPTNLPRAGIFAIFCTQSNDFAIGYPIVAALYQSTHPEYASYLYLMAPISLAILNPISFVLIEIGKRRTNDTVARSPSLSINAAGQNSVASSSHKEQFKLVSSVAKSIFFNPIIFMTLLGILGNLLFRHNIPVYFGGILKVLGSAFSATALFLLGLRMVGKVHKLRGPTLVVPGILIIAKLLVLPLVTREVVSLLHAGSNATETLDLSTYGFLYGTFPAAPTVFVFASQYAIDVDLIASAMVACTFISAPLMFVSAKMITITKADPSEYIKQLDAFTFDISIGGAIACLWVMIVYSLTRKILRMPHRITTFLVFSQLLSCIGAILWNSLDRKEGLVGYVQFAMFTVGVYSSRIWTALLAVTLLFLQCRSLCYVLKLQPFFIILGWGVPVILSVILLLFDKTNSLPYDKRNPNFVYGVFQAIIAVALLVLCFIVTVGCLILHQRHRKRYERYWTLAHDVASTFDHGATDSDVETTTNNTSASSCVKPLVTSSSSNSQPICQSTTSSTTSCSGGMGSSTSGACCGGGGGDGCPNYLPTIVEGGSEDGGTTSPQQRPSVTDIEDLFGAKVTKRNVTTDSAINGDSLCPTRFGCGETARDNCPSIVQRYQDAADDHIELIEQEPDSHDPQILQHIVLLILLLCSMFVGLAISIWTLVMEQMSGIYIELSFIDAALNCGQSIIVFAVFGTDCRELVLPLVAHWRRVWHYCSRRHHHRSRRNAAGNKRHRTRTEEGEEGERDGERSSSEEEGDDDGAMLVLPTWDELSMETRHTCDQFVTHHLGKCRGDIAENKRWRIKIYRNVFSGARLVDWLIDVGVARDRIEAVHYARHLVEGKVLKHINSVYHFYDRNLLYTFN